MFTLGVTGGIGCGKTLVTKLFEQKGIFVVDADEQARVVVEPDSPGLNAIIGHFGKSILQPDKTLNRKKLREIIFAQKDEKAWLENLLHPLIRQQVVNALNTQKNCPYQIYSAPLLLEQNQLEIIDKLLVVDCPVELQINRVTARDNTSKADVKKIIAQQVTREYRLDKADFVIDNSGEIENTEEQVEHVHHSILQSLNCPD